MCTSVKIVCFYFAVTQVLSAFGMDCQCGTPSDSILSMRIVGGKRAEPHSFPWAVGILKQDRMHCGGAVITTLHVLSAGHCFKWDDINNLKVLIGLDDMANLAGVEQRRISSVKIHENFTSTAMRDENDIAIATLHAPVQFSDTIIPVCLPQPGESFARRVGTIVGWGRIGVDKTSSKVLLKANVRIQADEECSKSALSAHLKIRTMMCAYAKGIDGCQGDSGGPLMVFQTTGKYVQVGVVSWGIGCADPKYPGIYTKVSQYVDWIRQNSKSGETCDN